MTLFSAGVDLWQWASRTTVLSSTDGVTWRPEDAGDGHWYLGVGFGNNTFVAVGTDGLVTTSLDAEEWVARESGTTNWLYDVAWGEAGFVGVGYAGAIVSSADGVTWTNRSLGHGQLAARGGGVDEHLCGGRDRRDDPEFDERHGLGGSGVRDEPVAVRCGLWPGSVCGRRRVGNGGDLDQRARTG